MRKSARACDMASRAKTAAKRKRLTLRLPRPRQQGIKAQRQFCGMPRLAMIPSKPAVPFGSALIALLHLFHGLLGVVLRIEGADQVHLVSRLVAEHLASLAVVADIKLLGESGRSERRDQNCCNQILSHGLSLELSWPLTRPGREQSSGALLLRRNGLEAAYAGGGVANVTAPLGARPYQPPSQH